MTNIKNIPNSHDLSGQYGDYAQMNNPAFQASIEKLAKELKKEYERRHTYPTKTKRTSHRI